MGCWAEKGQGSASILNNAGLTQLTTVHKHYSLTVNTCAVIMQDVSKGVNGQGSREALHYHSPFHKSKIDLKQSVNF